MQTNKTILRNSEIVIFDKKNNFVATWVSFFSTHWIGNSFFFSCQPDFNAEKTQLVPFDRSNNASSTDVKVDGSVLEEK